jgi:FKBP-type peptidyl-prolyl cis-trans isomerase FkpA
MKLFPRVSLFSILVLSASLAACAPKGKEEAKADGKSADTGKPSVDAGGFKTNKEQVSYMVGMDIAQSLKTIKDDLDVDVLAQGMKDSFAKDGKPRLTEAQITEVRNAFTQRLQEQQAAKQAAKAEEGKKFLASNKTKPGVVTTTSGLQYQVLKPREGAKPTAESTVKVNYVGTHIDGEEFDSSYKTGQPAEFPVNGVIPGWTEGLQLMSVGSKYKFWIPSELAYGAGGQGPIGPNEMLIFEVELLEVK